MFIKDTFIIKESFGLTQFIMRYSILKQNENYMICDNETEAKAIDHIFERWSVAYAVCLLLNEGESKESHEVKSLIYMEKEIEALQYEITLMQNRIVKGCSETKRISYENKISIKRERLSELKEQLLKILKV